MSMRRSLAAFAALLILGSSAFAQGVGQLPSGNVWGNPTAARAPAAPTTPTALIDRAICGTQGTILYRSATAWSCLAVGTSGQLLQTGGAAANPAWTTATYPATTTINQVLYSSAANTVAGIATANGGVLNASATGVPAMTRTPVIGVPGTTAGTIGLAGLTSGTATIATQAVAGTPTLTLPNASGTFAVSVAAPLLLSTTTGAISWSGTSGGVPYFSSATAVASSGALGSNQIVLGGGAGVAPSTPVSLGTTTTVLHGNAAGAPSFASVSGSDIGSATVTGSNLAANTVANSNLATATANTVKGNFTGSTAAPADNAMPSCSATNAALQYTSGTGLSCITAFARLDTVSQTITGGANVTALAQSTGNITVDCGARPIQTITNNGAYTITAPSSDGYCLLKVTNGATAGATTFTGFSVGASTGDALTTTNGNKFIISVIRAGGDSTYSIKALQ